MDPRGESPASLVRETWRLFFASLISLSGGRVTALTLSAGSPFVGLSSCALQGTTPTQHAKPAHVTDDAMLVLQLAKIAHKPITHGVGVCQQVFFCTMWVKSGFQIIS